MEGFSSRNTILHEERWVVHAARMGDEMNTTFWPEKLRRR
jgi:hypothetical protein